MAAATANSFQRPTTRCSVCHAEYDVQNAAGHICARPPGPYAQHSNTPSMNSFPGRPPMDAHGNGPLHGKLPKFAPPARIDPFAANQAFPPPENLSAEIRSASPFTAPPRTASANSMRLRMGPRSATAPLFPERPLSIDMKMPQDGAFPLFPTKKVREQQARKERQRGKSMSRGQSSDRSRNFRNGTSSASASRSASPAIPQSPFPGAPNQNKAGSPYGSPSEPVPPLPTQLDPLGRASPKPDRHPSPSNESQVHSPLSAPPITPHLAEDTQQQPEPGSARRSHFRRPSVSAAIKPLYDIGSTRKPNQDLPASLAIKDPHVETAPPLPELQTSAFEQPPPTWGAEPTLPESPLLPGSSGPVAGSHIGPSVPNELDSLNIVPASTLDMPQNDKAHDKTRESASSDGSSYSVTHSRSSRSSPPTSASSFTLQNDLPRGENIDSVLSSIAEVGKSSPPRDSAATGAGAPLPLQQRRRGPAKSFSRPNYARPQLELPTATKSVPPSLQVGGPAPPNPQTGSQMPPSNPQAPAMAKVESRSPVRSPIPEVRTPPSSGSPMSPRLPHMPRPIRPGDPYANVPPSPSGSMRRPGTPGFKGNCRGCGEIIMGRSVSSADGRLTGRYHKQCFVCRTCREPFQTADFYVIDNHPYCHRHYHTLNDSLCTVCDRGIEGPYMETDAMKKFHPHCFTCKECHLILRHDYFEVDGAIYCEKHSKKPDLLGPGRRHPERRTTRLMMM